MFEHLAQFPERERRFANTTVEMTLTEGYNVQHLVKGYTWDEIEESIIVDLYFIACLTVYVDSVFLSYLPLLFFVINDIQV
jgi:hypothetical protein